MQAQKVAVYQFSVFGAKYLYDVKSQGGQGWKLEEIAFYTPTQGTQGAVPVHRFHTQGESGWYFHFNTKNKSPGYRWKYDGISFYAFNNKVNADAIPIYEYKDHENYLYSEKNNLEVGDYQQHGIAFWAYPK